jgi:mRNA interferase RelE/StbE
VGSNPAWRMTLPLSGRPRVPLAVAAVRERGLADSRDRRGQPLPPLPEYGYIIARMRYAVGLAPGAVRELRALPAYLRAQVRDAIERHLRHQPTLVSKSRIKRLRGLSRPQYRLRVGEVRVFYDVTTTTIEVLAIVSKTEAEGWLKREGTEGEEGSAG